MDILTESILEESRYEVLMQKFTEPTKKGKRPIMDKEMLSTFMKSDPTTTQDGDSIKKVGSYSQWIIKQYVTLQQRCDSEHEYDPSKTSPWYKCLEGKQKLFIEDLYKVTGDLKKFDRLKTMKMYTGEKDINKFKSTDELLDAIVGFNLDSDQYEKTKSERVRDDVDIVYEDKTWVIYIPKTKEASCHYAHEPITRWCTASDGTSNWYDHYNKQGPLYMVMHKDDMENNVSFNEARHHQFHFESDSFFDSRDRSVNPGDVLNKYVELKPFFKESFGKYINKSFGDVVSVRYPNDSASKYISIYGFEDFFNKLPSTMSQLKIVYETSGVSQEFELPDLSRFPNLTVIYIQGGLLKSLPESITKLKLRYLSVPKNPQLKELPKGLGVMPSLGMLNVQDTGVKLRPETIERWKSGDMIIVAKPNNM